MAKLFIISSIFLVLFVNAGSGQRCGPPEFGYAERQCTHLRVRDTKVYNTCLMQRLGFYTPNGLLNTWRMDQMLLNNPRNVRVAKIISNDFKYCTRHAMKFPMYPRATAFITCLDQLGTFFMMPFGYWCQRH